MKRLIPLAALAVGLLLSAAASAAEQTVKLAVGNMHCASCPFTVERALSAVPGATKVAVSFREKSAVVTFDDQKTNVQALIAAASNAGYPTQLAAAATPNTR